MAYSIAFNASHLPSERKRYICWIDIMGIQNAMAWSVPSTSNFIFKLHAVATKYKSRSIRLYPVMDGVYAVSRKQAQIEEFAVNVLSHLSQLFTEESTTYYRFVVRGAISYGVVVEGKDIKSEKVLPYFEEDCSYKNGIILGAPILEVYKGEHSAPPFGINICESAVESFSTSCIDKNSWFIWWKSKYFKLEKENMNKFHKAIKGYFDYFRKDNRKRKYDTNRLKEHEAAYLKFLGLSKW